MEFLKKYKKSIGIIMILVIVVISSILLYCKNGVSELNKNNHDDDIFVEENNEQEDNKREVETVNSKEDKIANKKNKKITVEIKGEVNKPDVYVLEESCIVKDLIDLAGGVTEKADLTNINRAKQLQNHELVYISSKDEIKSIENTNKSPKSITSVKSANGLININSADIEELKKINGIGDSKAKTIIEYRDKNGPFNSIEDIKNVGGIGDKMFEKIKEQITI